MCSAVADMGDCLATIDMGQKFGGCAPFGALQLYCRNSWTDEMPFGLWAWMNPRKQMLDGGPDPL